MKRISSIFLLLFVLVNTGCAATSTWWRQFKDNPVAGLQEGLGIFRTALGYAQAAFDLWAGSNPALAGGARTQFNSIVGNVQQGMLVAQDGLKVAADAHQSVPDLNALTHDAQAAMTDLNSFLAGLPGNEHGAADPTMLGALHATDRAAHYRF